MFTYNLLFLQKENFLTDHEMIPRRGKAYLVWCGGTVGYTNDY